MAAATGIPPSDLAKDGKMLATIVEVLNKQAKDAKR